MSEVTKISKALENLVGKRFNKQTLEAKLSEIFGVEVKVEDISHDDDELVDFNYLTLFDNKVKNIYGFVDIYFLPMRRVGRDDSTFYITEVNCEFE